jgi:cytochrome c-type biogenesis protein CcmH
MRNRFFGVVLGVFFFGVGAPALGQEGEAVVEPIQAHPEGDAAISRLKSPYCPGLMLEVCSHPDSKVLRDSLQAMAHEGLASDSLVAWMLGTYGEQYRAVPEARGSGLLAWVIPPFVLVVGFLLVVVVLRRFQRRRSVSQETAEPLSKEDESALAAALKEMKAAEEVPF